MVSGSHLTTVSGPAKDILVSIAKRRLRGAASAISDPSAREAFIQQWAEWPHDNVAPPSVKIDDNFIEKKYFISTVPRPKNVGIVADIVTWPYKEEKYRSDQLIFLEKKTQQMHIYKTIEHKYPYEQTNIYKSPIRKLMMLVGYLFSLIVIPFFIVVTLKKTQFYKKYFEGGPFDHRKPPYVKRPWDALKKNEKGEWTL
jgi:hypothetical protein